MAGEAILRENRPNVAVELNLIYDSVGVERQVPDEE